MLLLLFSSCTPKQNCKGIHETTGTTLHSSAYRRIFFGHALCRSAVALDWVSARRQVSMKFEDMIDRLEMPLVLIYGKEDPWVVPLWGHRIKRQRPETLYYQVIESGVQLRRFSHNSTVIFFYFGSFLGAYIRIIAPHNSGTIIAVGKCEDPSSPPSPPTPTPS